MAQNAQCSEDGPFFPSTPRYIVQNGIAVEQSILLAPDWLTISLVLVCVLVLTILLIVVLVSEGLKDRLRHTDYKNTVNLVHNELNFLFSNQPVSKNTEYVEHI